MCVCARARMCNTMYYVIMCTRWRVLWCVLWRALSRVLACFVFLNILAFLKYKLAFLQNISPP